jgi:hypothetical protein
VTGQEAVIRWHLEGTYLERLWKALEPTQPQPAPGEDLEKLSPKSLRYFEAA